VFHRREFVARPEDIAQQPGPERELLGRRAVARCLGVERGVFRVQQCGRVRRVAALFAEHERVTGRLHLVLEAWLLASVLARLQFDGCAPPDGIGTPLEPVARTHEQLLGAPLVALGESSLCQPVLDGAGVLAGPLADGIGVGP